MNNRPDEYCLVYRITHSIILWTCTMMISMAIRQSHLEGVWPDHDCWSPCQTLDSLYGIRWVTMSIYMTQFFFNWTELLNPYCSMCSVGPELSWELMACYPTCNKYPPSTTWSMIWQTVTFLGSKISSCMPNITLSVVKYVTICGVTPI